MTAAPWTFVAHEGAGGAEAAVQAVSSRLRPGDRLEMTGSLDDLDAVVEEVVASERWLGVVGGDGSLRACIEALRSHGASVPVGLVPAGTGNDLARTLGIPLEPEAAVAALLAPCWVDLDGLDVLDGQRRWLGRGVNAMVAGPPAEANASLDAGWKSALGPWMLRLKQPEAMARATPVEIGLVADDGAPEALEVLGYVVGSGRTAGGGVMVAPGADPTDGWLDLLLLRPGDPLALAGAITALLAGEADAHPLVERRIARRLQFEPPGALAANLDGDLLGGSVAEVACVGAVVPFAVGPQGPPWACALRDGP